jgi:hypothetical protein
MILRSTVNFQVFVEILLKPLKPILARTVANQTGVIPAASFQSATPTNHPLLVGKPQARLIKMAKLTTPILQKRKRLAPVTLATEDILLVMVLLWCVLCDSMMVKVASLTGMKGARVSIRTKLVGWGSSGNLGYNVAIATLYPLSRYGF